MRIWPGKPYPLGATWDGMGVNFALFSENAEKVELCLFRSPNAKSESIRIVLPEYTDQVWHVYLPDVRPGQLYGYRVYGPYDPAGGNRFNHNKVLFDPYGKALGRALRRHESLFAYSKNSPQEDLSFDSRDNAAHVPLAAVVDPAFTWGDDSPPLTPWHKTIIYETHVKGMTWNHPEIPKHLRGSYAGLATEPVLRHLKDLGVTAIELMPIHLKVDEWRQKDLGLTNYWGYNTLAYFAPDTRFTSYKGYLAHVREFKLMVRSLHASGIEVILDVVYNHTGEGNHLGPTLSFRGIDNKAYYRLLEDNSRYYKDFTGCGNTMNMLHPRVLQLIMDSLRYWVQEMHVDGFRFDLASALARELFEVNKLASFFDIIHQDPVLSQVKLIAEPWDLGEGGYQVGNFPVLWTEWNGKYRDNVRSFWREDSGVLGEFATRLTGSSDLYGGERSPYASINYITCHDGFTLHDLVSYEEKHNDANGENNQDGTNDNRSWNCGVEGETSDTNIEDLRFLQKRNLLTTLLLSAGVPMISGGDELSRSQYGNNNTYCHDSAINWYQWILNDQQKSCLDFIRELIAFRKAHPVFERRKFFSGKTHPITGFRDITWYAPSGAEMTGGDWNHANNGCIGVCLSGDAIDELDEKGQTIKGHTMLLLFQRTAHDVLFRLPRYANQDNWLLIMDTTNGVFHRPPTPFSMEGSYPLKGRSIAVFQAA